MPRLGAELVRSGLDERLIEDLQGFLVTAAAGATTGLCHLDLHPYLAWLREMAEGG